MARKKQHGSVKRFGARYGRTLREKLSKIEATQHQHHKCPYCLYPSVTRVAAGIWECSKCSAKFTSKAYTVAKQSKKTEEHVLQEPETQETVEETEETTKEKGVKYKDVVGVVEEAPAVTEATKEPAEVQEES